MKKIPGSSILLLAMLILSMMAMYGKPAYPGGGINGSTIHPPGLQTAAAAEANDNSATDVKGKNGLKMIVIDVGQGLSELIILPDGKTLLVDGGDRDKGDVVLSALQQNGVTELDAVVATHPHADHIGGLVDVLNDVDVKEVIDSGQAYTTRTFENFVDVIDSKKIPLLSVHDGDTIDLDPAVALNVLNPPATLPVGADNEPDFNNNSVVIELKYGNFTAMLPGDMQQENEERLAARGGIDVDVLVAGHHGSRTSSSTPFLEATSPDTVIISAGAGNTYGHPHPEALARIKAAGVSNVLRTDIDGTVTVSASADGSYTIETSKTNKVVAIPEFAGIATPVLVASISLITVITFIVRNNDSRRRLHEGRDRQG